MPDPTTQFLDAAQPTASKHWRQSNNVAILLHTSVQVSPTSQLVQHVLSATSSIWQCILNTIHSIRQTKLATFTRFNKAIVDRRLPQCHILNSTSYMTSNWYRYTANSFKHSIVLDSGPLASSYENMTWSVKPEVHNVSQCHQRRTKPRLQATCTKILQSSVVQFSSYTSGQTDRQTYSSQYFASFLWVK